MNKGTHFIGQQYLIFYFAKNREDNFSLRYVKFEDKISVTVTRIFLSRTRVLCD